MTCPPRFTIAEALSGDDLAEIRRLFREYAASLDVDLAYQGFDAELAGLPGKYAPPQGALLLARDDSGAAVGCVAMRPLPTAGLCEMKRLYVAPAGRRIGLGEALVGAVLAQAERAGHREIRLDSLPSMAAAVALYRKAGFTDMDPYYDTPVAGTVFLRRPLGTSAAG